MIYSATITSSNLRVRESRTVAQLLLDGVSASDWKAKVLDENVLQLGSIESRKRVSRLLRSRLEPLGSAVWNLAANGSKVTATQAVFAGAVKNSRLLGDFMDLVVREHRSLHREGLSQTEWRAFIDACRSRDPEMPVWSESTVNKLRSAVYSMLAEAQYIDDFRSLKLQTVFVDESLKNALRDAKETYVLRCLEVTE